MAVRQAVAVPHPLRSTRRPRRRARRVGPYHRRVPRRSRFAPRGRSVDQSAGFCLKSMNPPCPSGRPNHDCHYPRTCLDPKELGDSNSCRQCEIGETARWRSGPAPRSTRPRPTSCSTCSCRPSNGGRSPGLFVLCRYLLRPFAVGLLASGIRDRCFRSRGGRLPELPPGCWRIAESRMNGPRSTSRGIGRSVDCSK